MSDTGYVGIIWQVKWFALTDISFSIRDHVLLECLHISTISVVEIFPSVEHKLYGLYQGGLALGLG